MASSTALRSDFSSMDLPFSLPRMLSIIASATAESDDLVLLPIVAESLSSVRLMERQEKKREGRGERGKGGGENDLYWSIAG